MPSINGQIITCEYEIKVSLYFNCFVDYNHRPRVIIPIYIVHQLPIDYQLEIQEQIDFENALKKSKMEEEDNKYFNNQLIKNKDNYNNKMNNMNEEEEDNDLPSLEVIEEARKNQIKDNENKIDNYLKNINVINDNNVNNDIYNNNVNINEIDNNDNINDSCPPPNSLYESAPLPFQIKDNNNNNNNNRDSNNFENNFNNQININSISESPQDFSVLNNINSL
jgi:hypothetical protein